jgi:hypothetical protein
MSKMMLTLLVAVLMGASLACAEEPPYKRVLQGEDAKKAAALEKQISELWAAGMFADALEPAREVLALRQRVQSNGHHETADAARQVETLRKVAALPAEQRTALAAAPAIAEKAEALYSRGKYGEAEPLRRQALAAYEAWLGPKHPDTAISYNNLARNLDAQGRAKEAEPLHRKALAIKEEVLGAKHPGTAISYNNLAINLQHQGRAREAEPLYRQALAIREEVLGPKHPLTATSYSSVPYYLDAQGRAKEAEPLHRQALAIQEEVLGPKHPDTAQSYTNLATNLQVQGRAKEAEALWQAGADGVEAARLRLATATFDKAAALRIQPHLGLAACRARLHRAPDAWAAAEAGLARGLLDDLAAHAGLAYDPDADRCSLARASRLSALDRLLPPLLMREKLNEADRQRRDVLLKERNALDDDTARAAADLSRKAVLPLDRIQEWLASDAALVFWVDLPASGDHWGCVVRHSGPPVWVALAGSGAKDAWTKDDDQLPRRLRDDLSRGEPDPERHARLLAAQRLEPLAPHLGAVGDLPAVGRLVVVPAGRMAGIPV